MRRCLFVTAIMIATGGSTFADPVTITNTTGFDAYVEVKRKEYITKLEAELDGADARLRRRIRKAIDKAKTTKVEHIYQVATPLYRRSVGDVWAADQTTPSYVK